MILSALIKKGGLTRNMTATPATPATHKPNSPVTVAPVATVAVAEKRDPPLELTPDEESIIRAWLAHIEETDPAMIAEVLDKCRDDLDARQYFLKRSGDAPKPVIVSHPVICRDCRHFERTGHPHLGHCAKGVPGTIAGLWYTDRRYCECMLPTPKQTNNSHSRPVRAETKKFFPN